jgi:hypothetical protein
MDNYIITNLGRILPRLDLLVVTFDKLKKSYEVPDVQLNESILFQVVVSYFQDIDRFKEYTGAKFANSHKQAAYTFKWISKLRPVQIQGKPNQDIKELMFNSIFAIYASLSFLSPLVLANISDEYFGQLLYFSTYRNISGRHLSSTFYLLEQASRKEFA